MESEREAGRQEDPAATDATADGIAAQVAELEARLAEVSAEREERHAAYVRARSDLDNVRKRKAQELADARRHGGEPLLLAILPALDSLDRAVEHLPHDDRDPLTQGLRLTLRQLEAGLAAVGIHRIRTEGEPFDPSVHEAVAIEPGGAGDRDAVVRELRPGYRYHDRVVRPAQVAVARAGDGAAPGPGEDPAAGAAGDPGADPGSR